jgi:hypothetical protein
VFTKACHCLSWWTRHQPKYPNPIPFTPILTVPSHLQLGLSSGNFPSGFQTETLYMFLITSNIPREVQITKPLITFSSASCHFFPLPQATVKPTQETLRMSARFQVLTAASMKTTVSWDAALCSLADVNRRFRDACWLHDRDSSQCMYVDYTSKSVNVVSVMFITFVTVYLYLSNITWHNTCQR